MINPDQTADVAEGVSGASHETQFDPIVSGSFTVLERTATSGNIKTLTASVVHGQRVINIGTPVPAEIIADAYLAIDDSVAGKEEYTQVKSVNTATGEVVLKDGLFFGNPSLLGIQAFGVAVTIVYSVAVTFFLLKVIDAVIGLRVQDEEEVDRRK